MSLPWLLEIPVRKNLVQIERILKSAKSASINTDETFSGSPRSGMTLNLSG